LLLAVALAPVAVACSSSSTPAQQPQQGYSNYPAQGAPTYQTYPQNQPYPAQTAPAQTAAPTATGMPGFPFPMTIPSNLPAMIPSGMFPGFPMPTPQ
jgi:hypothetical protein